MHLCSPEEAITSTLAPKLDEVQLLKRQLIDRAKVEYGLQLELEDIRQIFHGKIDNAIANCLIAHNQTGASKEIVLNEFVYEFDPNRKDLKVGQVVDVISVPVSKIPSLGEALNLGETNRSWDLTFPEKSATDLADISLGHYNSAAQ